MLASKKADFVDRLIERNCLSPRDRDEVFHFIRVIRVLPKKIGVVGAEHIQYRLIAPVICCDLKVAHRLAWTFNSSDANEAVTWHFDPNTVPALQKLERVGIPGAPAAGHVAIPNSIRPRSTGTAEINVIFFVPGFFRRCWSPHRCNLGFDGVQQPSPAQELLRPSIKSLKT